MSDRSDIPGPKAPNFEQRVRETLMTYLGRQGDPLDRGLTLRDLIQAGVIKLRDGFTLKPGQAGGTIPLQPSVVEEEPDLTPPPQPTGFTVSAAISHVFIEHDAPVYPQGRGHLRTRVYGATVQPGDPLPVFDDAVEITQFSGTVHAHPSDPSTTWRLWIKWETIDNVLSVTPAGGTNGLAVTTGQDVAKLVAAMTGPGNPFKIVTEEITLPDGTVVPAGTYTADAYIHNSQIVNAMIANLAVDNAKIASLSADKLTAGSISVGQHIQSAGYIAGSAGWRINGDGNAELSNAVVRGTVYASNGEFTGTVKAGTTILGGVATSYSSGSGFYAGLDSTAYKWRVGNPTGARIQWTGSAIEVYNSSNQLTITSGGISASFVSGLGDFAVLDQITSSNISTYIASAAIGTAYIANAAITQAKIGNAAVGSAQIEDAAIGSAKIADASVTKAKIGNAQVDTLQIASNAVTVPVYVETLGDISYSNSWTTIQSAYISIPTGNNVIIFGYAAVYGYMRILDPDGLEIALSFGEGMSTVYSILGLAQKSGTYTLQAKMWTIGSANASQRSMLMIGVKR